jgi:hypothetical protein
MTPFFCKRSVLAFVALAGIVLVQVLCGRAVAAGETETLPDAPVFSTSSLGPVTLRYKFTPGMTTSLRMDLKLRIQMANLKETSIRFGMSAQYTVDSVDAAGRATATMVISELRGGGSTPNGTLIGTTGSSSVLPDLLPLSAMSGIPMKIKISPRGELLDYDVQPLLDAVRRAGYAEMLQASDQKIKDLLRSTFVQLPGGAVNLHDRYQAGSIEQELEGGMGSMSARVWYDIASISGDLRKVVMCPGAKYTIKSSTVSQIDVQRSQVRGWILFNVARGNIDQSKGEQEIKFTVRTGDQSMTVRVQTDISYRSWDGPSPQTGTARAYKDRDERPVKSPVQNTAVVGVKRCEVFSGSDLQGRVTDIKAGARVSLRGDQGGVVEINTSDGTKGWVRRCYLCSDAEYRRRKTRNEIPDMVTFVGAEPDGRMFTYGRFNIRNNKVVILPGQALWMDVSATGKKFTAASHRLTGDPGVLFLYKQDRGIARLPILETFALGGGDSVERTRRTNGRGEAAVGRSGSDTAPRQKGLRSIAVGDSRERVITRLGEPLGQSGDHEDEALLYKDGWVDLKKGKVVSVQLQ